MNRSPLPAAASRWPSVAAPTRPPVLIVDDVEANLVALRALLDGLSCEVVVAKSGNEALRQLLKREFAVILLDVQMPEMDGYEVAHHARENPSTRDIPIIFLTAAHHSEDNVLRGYGSGAVDFLFKPIDPPILRSKVRVFLELYAQRRQIADAKTALERSNTELRQLADSNAALAEKFRAANEDLEKAYRELQTTQGQLIQSAKMASLGELVAGVAHEINNPLSFATSHLDTARRIFEKIEPECRPALSEASVASWTRADSRLREMATGLERIAELVVKLRTFSRLDEGEQKKVSIRECVESVLMILQHRMGDRIRVEKHLGEPDRIDCFAGLLNQALLNLVSNAIDAIEGEGQVTVTTGAEGDAFAITVTDTGCGIPDDLRERVLEPFFTTKPVGQGTGLGLSITYSIVRRHGGTLELSRREGGGTVASIRLPMNDGAGRQHAS
jgi:two-component system, NtrC family, sensor kinase